MHDGRDIQASLERQLDDALVDMRQRRAREDQQRAEIVAALERFLAAGESGLRAAVALIEERGAEALSLATPIEVNAEIQLAGPAAVARSAQLTVSIRRSGENATACSWSLLAHATPDTHGDVRASFHISGWRGRWQDIWSENSADIRTPECNPRGLSLDTDGEEIARRFMAWFTKYAAR